MVGGVVPLVQGVRRANTTASANYGVSADGTLAYVPGISRAAAGVSILAFVTNDGTPQSLSAEPRDYGHVRISPDGLRLAVEVTEGRGDAATTHIWIVDTETGVATQLTFEGSSNQYPVWTPDGGEVLFASNRDDEAAMGIYRKAADGSGTAEIVVEPELRMVPTDVSGDGVLLFQINANGNDDDFWTVPLEGGRAPSVFLATTSNEFAGQFSSDGQWVAYVSNESDENRIYVRPYPATEGGQQRISDDFGVSPVWAPDDSAMYYSTGVRGGRIMTTSIQSASGFLRGPLVELFVGGTANGFVTGLQLGNAAAMFDVHPDGERFVWARLGDEADERAVLPPQVIIVQNWTTELERLVPTD